MNRAGSMIIAFVDIKKYAGLAGFRNFQAGIEQLVYRCFCIESFQRPEMFPGPAPFPIRFAIVGHGQNSGSLLLAMPVQQRIESILARCAAELCHHMIVPQKAGYSGQSFQMFDPRLLRGKQGKYQIDRFSIMRVERSRFGKAQKNPHTMVKTGQFRMWYGNGSPESG